MKTLRQKFAENSKRIIGKKRLTVIASFAVIALMSTAAFSSTSTASSIVEFLINTVSLNNSQTKPDSRDDKTKRDPKTSKLRKLAPEAVVAETAKERQGHTATLLNDGNVLIAGGDLSGTAEIVDAATGASSAVGNLTIARRGHTATKLSDGRVLITGGTSNGVAVATTEIYDPSAKTFSAGAKTLNAARSGHTATVLEDGKVLIAGGDEIGSAEIYDSSTGEFSSISTMTTSRAGHSAILMKDGRVLIVGGKDASGAELNSAEIFDPSKSDFAATGNQMAHHRSQAVLRVLHDGKVQIIGGNDDASMEVYDPAIDAIGAHGHVIPTDDEHDNLLQSDILSAPTRAAMFHNGQTDAMLDRSNFTVTELGGKALIIGGVDSNGNVLSSSTLLNSSNATVSTDKLDYHPGETAVISGTGWQAGETVNIILHEDPHTTTERRLAVQADENGNFRGNYSVEERDLNVTFIIGAKGQISNKTAQTTFTDGNATVSGKITDSLTGNPISGASVQCTAASSCNGSGPTTTGSDGTYSLSISFSGSSTSTAAVVASATGYTSQTTTNFSATNNSNVTKNFQLVPNTTATTTTISSSVNPSTFGQSVTFTATVVRSTGTGSPTGSIQFKVDGTNFGSTVALTGVNTTSATATSSATTSLAIGNRVITAEYTPGTGFSTSTGTLNQTVNKANQTITFGTLGNKTYGDADFTISATASSSLTVNFAAVGNCTVSSTTVHITGAGNCTITASQAGNTNYNAATPVSQSFSIGKATLTATAQDASRGYGDANPSFSVLFSNFVNSETLATSGVTGTPSCTTTAIATSPASPPTYPISCTAGTLASSNYTFNFVDGKLTVTKANLTVTADNQSREYGDGNPTFTFQFSGFKNNETSAVLTSQPTCTSAATTTSAASPPTYSITCSGGSAANYNFSYNAGTLTVNKAVLTVTANNKSRAYGAANPTFDAAITGFKNSETLASSGVTGTPNCSTTAVSSSSAAGSPYPITCAAGTLAASNYTFNFVSGSLTVTKAILTATAQDASREYGDANPSFAVAFGGFVNNETLQTSGITGTPNCTTTAALTSPASPPNYPISCTVGTLTASNYDFTFVNGNLTVTKASLTVSAANQSRGYGDANPTFAPQYGTFKNGETTAVLTTAPTCTSSATATSPVSPPDYPIVCSGGVSANYNFNYVNGALTVTKAALTVSANDKSREYGDANPTLDGNITGVKNGENITANYTTSATQTSAVGAYSIVPALVDPDGKLSNYTVTSNNGTLTVTAAVLTVTANDKNRAYGAANPSFDVLLSNFKNGESLQTSGITGTPVCSTTATGASPASPPTYPISCTAGTLASNNYTFNFVNGKLTVTKANLTVKADNKSRGYGANNPAFTYTISGFVNSENETTASITGAPVLTTSATAATAVGNYSITVDTNALSAPNYNFQAANGNLEITAAALTVSADSKSKNYGEANPGLSYSVTGFANGEDATSAGISGSPVLSTTATINTAVGGYPIIVNSVGTLTAANYTFVASTTNGTLTVNARAITVTADPQTKNYGNADPSLTYQVTSGLLVSGDSFTGGLTRAAGESVGDYAIGQGTLSLNSNYNLTFNGANLTITSRAITVNADPKTKTYGNADPTLSYQITSGSLAFSDSFNGSLTRTAGESVGVYPILQGTLALNSNYALNYIGADLSVTSREITVKADAKNKTYGDADPALTYQITVGTLVSGDNFSGSLSRAAGEEVGVHAIQQGTLALNGNYNLSFVGDNLTIGKRSVTISADAKSKIYGESDPALTYQLTGGSLASGDGFTGGLIRDSGESFGQYAIKQGTLALNDNYNLSFVGANFSINKRSVTVKVNPGQGKTYGDADPSLSVTVTGTLVNGDAFTGNIQRTSGENVGVYPIIQGSLALSGNYDLAFEGADFTISARAITITADAKNKMYGESDPVLTYQITGGTLAGSDGFTGSLSRDSGENVGQYQIKQGTVVLNGNYNLTYIPSNLIVNARSIEVTADAKTKIYGENDPNLTYRITNGALVGNDSFSGNLTRDAGSNVGNYAIKKGTLALSTNYNLLYVGANLTITKKGLTITASSPADIIYGSAVPTVTAGYDGFITGDTAANSLSAQPSCGTNYTVNSAVGAYTTSCSGAVSANYEISYVSGGFKVNKADQTITFNQPNNQYIGVGGIAVSATGGGSGNSVTFASSTPGVCTVIGTNVSFVGLGDCTITASQAGSGNYNAATNVARTFKVNPDPTTIVLDLSGHSLSVYDCIKNVIAATVKDNVTNQPVSGAQVTLAIGSQSVTVVTNNAGKASGTIILNQTVGTYSASATFAGTGNFAGSSVSQNVMITPNTNVGPGRDATSLYSGSLWFWTSSSTSSTATLTLSATIMNTGECNGDITKAKVSFLISTNGGTSWSPVSGAQNLPVGLVNPNDPNTGTASVISQYNIGTSQAVSLSVRVVVGGQYNSNTSQYDQLITIGKPGQTNSLMGGGELKNDGVPFKADGFLGGNSLKSDFSTLVTYTKSGTNPKGDVTVTITSCNKSDGTLEPGCTGSTPAKWHTYFIKSNAISELSLISGSASFGSKTNVSEVLPDGSKVGLDGGGTMQLVFTPYGKPFPAGMSSSAGSCTNQNGCASIVAFKSSGGVWYSSAWGQVGTSAPKTYLKNVFSGIVSIQ